MRYHLPGSKPVALSCLSSMTKNRQALPVVQGRLQARTRNDKPSSTSHRQNENSLQTSSILRVSISDQEEYVLWPCISIEA